MTQEEETGMRKGVRFIVSGFAGTGKGTVIKELLKRHEGYVLSVSATTRAPRDYEQDGREYFFISQEKFDEMVEEDAFLEYARYTGNSYGTPKSFVEEQLSRGLNVILEIEVQGALQVKERYPDTPLIFLVPPSMQELRARLEGRGTEDAEKIARRLARAKEEVELIPSYDYVLVNDDAAECAERLHGVIESIHAQASRNLDLVQRLQREAEELF